MIELRPCLEAILFAGIAFAVALFSHIVNHTMIRLQNAFYQLHEARVKTNESDSEEEERQQVGSHRAQHRS
jgi:hypothetical protein